MKQNGHLGHGIDPGQTSRLAYLIAGYVRKTLTTPEHDELDRWVTESDENMKLFEELTDETNMDQNLLWLDQLIIQKKLKQVKEKNEFKKKEKPFISWKVWVAAASLVLMVTIYIVWENSAGTKTKPVEITRDVLPGGNKATLTLSDGSVLDLSIANKGVLENDHGTILTKPSDGELVYTSGDSLPGLYNTITTPQAGQYNITLSDGTKVWLNAESSLRYPLTFSGKERKVDLRGEGYFEVAKNLQRPFKVILDDQSEIKVLGTHFNIMSYSGEPAKEITLLEGSVEITSGNNRQQMVPGEQVKIISAAMSLVKNVDTEEITGWKNGEFIFHNEEISFIMRQLARWYGVKIIYQVNTSEHFNATISRNEPVSKLLHYLESTGKIHFKIENHIIYVLP